MSNEKVIKMLVRISKNIIRYNEQLFNIRSLRAFLYSMSETPTELDYYETKIRRAKAVAEKYFFNAIRQHILHKQIIGEILEGVSLYACPGVMRHFTQEEIRKGKCRVSILEKKNGRYTRESTLYEIDLTTGEAIQITPDDKDLE